MLFLKSIQVYLIGKIIEVYWALFYSIVRNDTFIAIDPVHLLILEKYLALYTLIPYCAIIR